MTHEVIVSPRLADQYNLSVNDTLHIGGTLESAREHEFRVVGISILFERFLGTPTVTLHLSELQEVSGTTGSDRASLIAISIDAGANANVVEQRLERRFPDFSVRTNDEQVGAIIGGQSTILASAGTLVVLAIVSGTALILNVLSLLVAQQRNQFAALKAAGVSGRLLAVTTLTQGLSVGLLGGAIGVLLSGLAYVNLDTGSVPSTTLRSEYAAAQFAVQYVDGPVATDHTIGRLLIFSGSEGACLPTREWLIGGLPPACPLISQRSWTTTGAHLFPAAPQSISSERYEATLAERHVVYSASGLDPVTLSLPRNGNASTC